LSDERGVAAIAMAAMAALLATIIVGVVSVGVVFAARSQAVAGADAAALAAAVATYPAAANNPPTQVAASVAKANGVELVSCICRVDSSLEIRVVVVIVGVLVDTPILGRLSIRAGARAEFDPRRWLGR